MRLLLDTHIWIWGLVSPDRLSPEVRSSLSDPQNELWLSAVSVWETLVLMRKGRPKIRSEGGPTRAIEALGWSTVREAPITSEVFFTSEQLALDH